MLIFCSCLALIFCFVMLLLWIQLPAFAHKKIVLLVFFVFLSITSSLLYGKIGASFDLQAFYAIHKIYDTLKDLQASKTLTAPLVDAHLQQISKQLPAHAGAWEHLGDVYQNLQWYSRAEKCYLQSYNLNNKNLAVQIKLIYASSLASGGRLEGHNLMRVKTLLQNYPNKVELLNLVATDHFQRGKYAQALQQWEAMLKYVSNEEEQKPILLAITKVKSKLGKLNINNSDIRLEILVKVSKNFKRKIPPETPVFVFAKLAEEKAVPLAVQKLTFKDLPKKIVLTTLDAMLPDNRLRVHQKVIVGARIALSNNALGLKGDLETFSDVVEVKNHHQLELILDEEG
ncbi:MAG TPA: hypothetical protein VFP93_02945 [Gammaproteobacteria bacterium]|nr:hypothetical protein [Gammaproteobacteria bacterium]